MNSITPNVASVGKFAFPYNDGTNRTHQQQGVKFDIKAIGLKYDLPLPEWISIPDDPFLERFVNGNNRYKYNSAHVTKLVHYYRDHPDEYKEWRALDRSDRIPYDHANPFSNLFEEATPLQCKHHLEIIAIEKIDAERSAKART